MTNSTRGHADLAALERVLEAFGTAPARWPADQKTALAALVEGDPQARQLVAEARALELALDRAPVPDRDAEARVLDRVMAVVNSRSAQAAAKPATGNARANVVDLALRRAARGAAPQVRNRNVWRAVSLMAAALLLGIYLGVSGFTQMGSRRLQDVAALAAALEPEAALSSAYEEDAL
jgi:hypothetical protein